MRGSFRRVGISLFISSLLLACSLTVPTVTPAEPGVETPYRYDDLPSKVNESATIAEYRAISTWNKLDITYAFVNGTNQLEGDVERDLIRRAFALWSGQTELTFSEATESTADIVIGWAVRDHGDGDPFDGLGDVLAHASFPNPYDNGQVFLHFDDDERWVDSDTRNVDLLTVAAHEIGHTLGLAHSNDPNALMFPSYSGPHRFLDDDDIAGVQSLYGVASAPEPAPEAPPENATPPPAAGQDSDADGISDDDEVLVTGTDANNPDSDNDGLVDGVEVANHMNPLDPDMDKDGVPDGQEVNQGTDPFFPEQADIPADLENQISEFLTRAIELQIEAYQNGDASIASPIMAGPMLDSLAAEINALNQQGLVSISEIDYYQSYINDIRVVNNSLIEVDTCEVWTTNTYRLSDSQLVDSQGPELLPQTITIEQLDGSWFITNVNFLDAPAFCS
ncbi:MAG TPA: matrixin family metalloprotease [Anaerolineales bacterium]|nr:matrixin family metalloprotease [Anaerolineales bacterium]